jgi:hypothetical protein
MVMAIKSITSALSDGIGMGVYNSEDKQNLNFSGNMTMDVNTWVPYQNTGKHIYIQVKDEKANFKVISEFYLWDNDYKLICSAPDGLKTILTVSGNQDIGITVTVSGVQAHFV